MEEHKTGNPDQDLAVQPHVARIAGGNRKDVRQRYVLGHAVLIMKVEPQKVVQLRTDCNAGGGI